LVESISQFEGSEGVVNSFVGSMTVRRADVALNGFCPTGKGGGSDNTCGTGKGEGKDAGGGDRAGDKGKGAAHQPPKPAPKVDMHTDDAAKASLKKVFGDRAGDHGRIAAACNAKEGAKVTVKTVDSPLGAVEVTVLNPDGGHAVRRFYKHSDGSTHVSNAKFENPPGAKERGVDVFTEQVRSLRDLGVKSISTDATRDDNAKPPPPLVGHIVWPKLGYEGKLTDKQFKALPLAVREKMGEKRGTFGMFGSVPGSRSVQELHKVPGGPEAWATAGSTVYGMSFDLSDGSTNMKALEAYHAKKKGGK
jgi:hypothetical protein